MATVTATETPSRRWAGRLFAWMAGILCFGLMGYVLAMIAYQMFVPPPAHRLLLVQDIPLPSGLGTVSTQHSLAPGVQLDFDGFDFQTIDQPTHLLFIAHTGPSPDLMTLAHTKFDPKFDGNIAVFDLQQDKVVGRINVPQIAGIVDAPDVHKVYAADAQDDIVWVINPNNLQQPPKAIQLTTNEGPDAMSYDPTDHKVFVSDPGTSPGSLLEPNLTMNADRHNENVTVIDALTDTVVTRINLGLHPLFGGEQAPVTAGNIPTYGHDVGHNKYDEGLRHVFVTSQILPNADDPNPFVLPPPHTGELFSIDPVRNVIDNELILPAYCSTPHGMNIDESQQVAFIACTDFGNNLFENLVRVDLRNWKVIPDNPGTLRLAGGADMVVIDHPQNALLVGCAGGISIFDIKPGEFHKYGDYVLGKGTHTITIDEQTQQVFLPQFAGGIPVLRIVRYNANGV